MEILHRLNGHHGSWLIKVRVTLAEDVLFDLHTSYEMKIDEQRVAKALLSYYNSETTGICSYF